MRRRTWVLVCSGLALVTLIFSLVGCGSSKNHTAIRMVNAIPDESSLDLLIDKKSSATGVAYGNASSYVGTSPASHELQVEPSGTTTVLVDRTDTFTSGVNATLLTLNFSSPSPTSELLTDDNSAPTTGNFKLRIINAAPGLGPQDIYVVPAGAGFTPPATFSSLAFGSAAAYLSLAAGSYDIIFTSPGTTNVILESMNNAFSAGQVRTMLALNNPGGGFTSTFLTDVN